MDYDQIFLQAESSTVRQQLLDEFLPDDVCSLGSQLLMDTQGQISQFGMKDDKVII